MPNTTINGIARGNVESSKGYHVAAAYSETPGSPAQYDRVVTSAQEVYDVVSFNYINNLSQYGVLSLSPGYDKMYSTPPPTKTDPRDSSQYRAMPADPSADSVGSGYTVSDRGVPLATETGSTLTATTPRYAAAPSDDQLKDPSYAVVPKAGSDQAIDPDDPDYDSEWDNDDRETRSHEEVKALVEKSRAASGEWASEVVKNFDTKTGKPLTEEGDRKAIQAGIRFTEDGARISTETSETANQTGIKPLPQEAKTLEHKYNHKHFGSNRNLLDMHENRSVAIINSSDADKKRDPYVRQQFQSQREVKCIVDSIQTMMLANPGGDLTITGKDPFLVRETYEVARKMGIPAENIKCDGIGETGKWKKGYDKFSDKLLDNRFKQFNSERQDKIKDFKGEMKEQYKSDETTKEAGVEMTAKKDDSPTLDSDAKTENAAKAESSATPPEPEDGPSESPSPSPGGR